MRIAVDTRFFESDENAELKNFTKEVFCRLALQHAEHQFFFLTDTALRQAENLPANITTVVITPTPTNFLLYKWWYDVKLALALKKYKADIFIATYGFCSLTTPVKQVLVVRDLPFLQKKLYSANTSRAFYKRHTAAFVRKAKKVVTLSQFVKDDLVATYQAKAAKIQVAGSGANDFFKPLEWEEREAVKDTFAEGCEYFVFSAGFHSGNHLLNVLKAFSIFKKWQKTNMKLVIRGGEKAIADKDLEKLNSYKYRQDVIVKKDLSESEAATVVAGSYAVIFQSSYEGFALPVLEAMKCAVPVISSPGSSISEIAGDGALYADLAKPEEMAEQMKKIFKDEQLRNSLIEAGKQRSLLYSWDKTAAVVWQVIEEVVSR